MPLDKMEIKQEVLHSSEFSILRLTFYEKSALKFWIQE